MNEAFKAINFKGTYGTTGRLAIETFKLPRVHVEGVGRLHWPIGTYQIEQLKNVMENGNEHTTGEIQRKSLHIDCCKIEIDNCFDFLVENVANQLGLEGNKIEAKLNKLELHEEGGGFDWHQDTDKSKGKIGSLLIHLPSYYEGGELFIQHEGTLIKSIHNQQEGEDGFFYTAFHSDCFQKLNTITKGNRFTLLFDLFMKDSSSSGNNISIINANMEARNKLYQFIHSIHNENDNKQRFIIPLEHKYSGANRHNIFSLLQNRDREKLSLLQKYAR